MDEVMECVCGACGTLRERESDESARRDCLLRRLRLDDARRGIGAHHVGVPRDAA